jgi:hypothetical protein
MESIFRIRMEPGKLYLERAWSSVRGDAYLLLMGYSSAHVLALQGPVAPYCNHDS